MISKLTLAQPLRSSHHLVGGRPPAIREFFCPIGISMFENATYPPTKSVSELLTAVIAVAEQRHIPGRVLVELQPPAHAPQPQDGGTHARLLAVY